MAAHKELISYDGNEIYELKEEYIESSVKVSLKQTGSRAVKLTVSEIGGRFISLDIPDTTEIGDILEVTYKVKEKIIRKFDTDRLSALEKKVLEQEKLILELQKAVRNRISVRTFTSWLKALEQKLGVDIIDQAFQSPYPK